MGAPQSIARLVQWPVALTHFDCKVIWGQDINYKFLESCLLKHKNTLTHIRLGGCLARGNDGCTFDTRRFPNLQYLQVDYYDILASIWRNDRLNLHTNLLGPNLKVFVIDFQYRHCLDSEWCLGKEDISWLREFMQGAIAQRASLKTIKLIFDRHHLHTANDRGSYSRDRVAKTKAQIMELSGGIELEWCELVQPTRTWAESKAAEILQRRIRYCGTEEEDMDLDDYIDSLQL